MPPSLFAGANLTVMANGNDFLENRWQRPFWKRRMHRAFHQADHVVCCSNESKRILLESKTHALLPAVDPEEFAVFALLPVPTCMIFRLVE